MTEKNTHADGFRYHATGAEPIRLLVVDRHPALRRGFRMRLALEVDLEVVGEAGDVTEATPLARALRPGVILLDVEMPGGIATTKALRAAAPHGAVVVPALRDEPATPERAREAGAAASVAKHRTEGILLAAIRGVALANANRRPHERAPASGKEEQEDAMRDRRGA